MQIPKKSSLGTLEELGCNGCFFAISIGRAKKAAKVAATAITALIATAGQHQQAPSTTVDPGQVRWAPVPATVDSWMYHQHTPTHIDMKLPSTKHNLPNGVMVYLTKTGENPGQRQPQFPINPSDPLSIPGYRF